MKINSYWKENKPLWEIIILFSLVLALFTIYSFSEKSIEIFSVELQKSEIKNSLYAQVSEPIDTLESQTDTVKIAEETKPQIDTSSQRILLIGDSMLEGLMYRLRDYCDYNNHTLKTVIWYSSSTKIYGSSDTLDYFIKQFDPTFIFLVIGANELFVHDIKNKRDKYTKNIVDKVKTRKFVWVGPPNWKDDTGINDMILSNVGEKRFFKSKGMAFERNDDGAHPTRKSAAMWMDSICSWVMTKSMVPIILNKPDKTGLSSTNATLLQPL